MNYTTHGILNSHQADFGWRVPGPGFRIQFHSTHIRLPHHESQLITKAVEIGIHHHSMHPHGIEATSLVAMAAIWQPYGNH